MLVYELSGCVFESRCSHSKETSQNSVMVLKVVLFGDSKLHFETNKTLLMPATEFILSVEKLISVYFYGFMQAIENTSFYGIRDSG